MFQAMAFSLSSLASQMSTKQRMDGVIIIGNICQTDNGKGVYGILKIENSNIVIVIIVIDSFVLTYSRVWSLVPHLYTNLVIMTWH